MAAATELNRPTRGPLTVFRRNPRYFSDRDGNPVYLTGSHTWANLQEMGPVSPPAAFDYPGWLDFLVGHGHNFQRLWMFENPRWAAWTPNDYFFEPLPWARTGPGDALDGKPRFDLEQLDPVWFEQLRQRVRDARDRGVYTAVMLFQGWSGEWKGWNPRWGPAGRNPWTSHPFNPANNVNGVDGSLPGGEGGEGVHTLRDPEVMRLQREYIREVVRTVNEFDNVLYEIGNEHAGTAANTAWQYATIEFVREAEAGLPARHPLLMTGQWPAGRNDVLFAGPAEAVSPLRWQRAGDANWQHDPPDMGGSKVVVSDTDHLWGVGGDLAWVWKTFTRGGNPIYMDPWGYDHLNPVVPDQDVRAAMGATRRLAMSLDLARTTPRPDLSSSGFVLADPGRAYVVFHPYPDAVRVDLSAASGKMVARWLRPTDLSEAGAETVEGGASVDFPTPAGAPWVIHIEQQ